MVIVIDTAQHDYVASQFQVHPCIWLGALLQLIGLQLVVQLIRILFVSITPAMVHLQMHLWAKVQIAAYLY